MPFLGISGTRIEGEGIYPAPVLGRLSVSPAAAYSLRRLSASATRAIQVRRSSDNTTLDIGFVGSNLNVAALLTFVGAGNGFVTTWYDQVGSINATQATAILQPKIVNAGALYLNTANTASIKFDGIANTILSTGDFSLQNPLSINTVINNISYNNLSPFSNTVYDGFLTSDRSELRFLAINSYEVYANPAFIGQSLTITASTPFVSTTVFNNASSVVFQNGTSIATGGSAGQLNPGGIYIGNYALGTRGYDGLMSEFLIFNGVISTTNRQILERNQGAYYAISVA
jgi:hypothetical protein